MFIAHVCVCARLLLQRSNMFIAHVLKSHRAPDNRNVPQRGAWIFFSYTTLFRSLLRSKEPDVYSSRLGLLQVIAPKEQDVYSSRFKKPPRSGEAQCTLAWSGDVLMTRSDKHLAPPEQGARCL